MKIRISPTAMGDRISMIALITPSRKITISIKLIPSTSSKDLKIKEISMTRGSTLSNLCMTMVTVGCLPSKTITLGINSSINKIIIDVSSSQVEEITMGTTIEEMM
jgi:hypothetical protein